MWNLVNEALIIMEKNYEMKMLKEEILSKRKIKTLGKYKLHYRNMFKDFQFPCTKWCSIISWTHNMNMIVLITIT